MKSGRAWWWLFVTTACGPTTVIVVPTGGGPDAAATIDADSSVAPDSGASLADANVEGSVDAGQQDSAAACDGSSRCANYKHEQCSGGVWTTVNDDVCCRDSRFGITGGGFTMTDTTTGLEWLRAGGRTDMYSIAEAHCPTSALSGGHLPTLAQLATLVIGTGTCSPPVDHNVFTYLFVGPTYATDGCFDIGLGMSLGAAQCAYGDAGAPGFLCVK